jgi:phospholipase/carboxylesterase
MALFTGLRYPERLAGLAGLSTYLSFDDSLETERSAANGSTPIFLAHGTLDPMVPFEAGNRTRARLEKLGCPVTWRTYPMPHAICAEEIEDLRAWFVERLSPRTSSG